LAAVAVRHEWTESLQAAFRLLSDGEDLRGGGGAVLAQGCSALRAEEGALLLAGERPGHAFTLAVHHGRPGLEGPIGTRTYDPDRAAEVVASRRVTTWPVGRAGVEAWAPMLVQGRALGALAFRRWAAFSPRELATMEVLATGAALGADRLRFVELWSAKLAQADAQHAQLLRYADDLRTTYADERRRSQEVVRALDALETAYAATVRALACAMAEKDDVTGGHLARVSAYGVKAVECYDPALADTPGLEYAFLLHDVGKIGIPDAVLRKPGPLTDSEWMLMREHPAIGLRILEGVPQMEVVRDVVGCHHERWDGGGYPYGLAGEGIPQIAQLFATVDAFDAMTSDRPYQIAVTVDEAMARLSKASGTQFAPDAVRAFLAVDRDEIERIRTAPAWADHGLRRS
jgi:ribonuclease P protein subunit RPR2